MINITIDGPDAASVQAQMRRLLQGDERFATPAVSDTSSDKGDNSADNAEIAAAVESVRPLEPAQPQARRTRKPKVETVAPDTTAPAASELLPGGTTTAEFNAAVDKTVEADKAQDAADEAAETETTEDAPLTLDDVRNSALPYITKWGKEAAAKDLVPIVMAAGGVPNIGKLDPTDQALLRKVMTAFADAAKAETRFGQE